MNKKGQVTVGVLIIVFLGVIIGLALFSESSNSVSVMTDKQTITNQSVDVETAWINEGAVNESKVFTIYTQNDWRQQECPLTSVELRNATGDDLTLTTDYLLNATTGTFSLVDTESNQNSNTTYVDYSYCADGYNTNEGSRGVAGIILVFFALAILAFVLDRTGVINILNR